MGLTVVTRIRRAFAAAKRAISATVGHPMSPDVADYFGYPQSASGVAVDERLALGYAAVFACVRVLSESCAQLPIGVYRHLERGKQPERKHAAWRLLNQSPNPEMGAFTFRETLTGHVATWGNGYAEIERRGNGTPLYLWPLTPDRVTPKRHGRQLVYEVRRERGGTDTLDASDVLHVAGLGFDGLKGYSPIRLHRNAIGHGMAQETYSSRFFGNGSTPGGVIEYPGPMGEVEMRKFRMNWEAMHAGPDAAHRIGILDGGAKFNPISVDPESAQLLESRKFSVTEICRIYRVPPHMVADLERATFANIEQQSIDFVTYSLMAWLIRWEQEINRKLILPSESEDFFAKHHVKSLMRGDTPQRFAAYAQARQWGWMSANDVRDEEDENPLPDGGDIYLVPMNMHDADSPPEPPKQPSPPPAKTPASA